MAANLLAFLDDVAATLDDVATMTKISLKKTSALMSDDLAVNAGVVHGVQPSRELPIVGKIFAGSLINKLIAIAIVIGINAFYPPLLSWILILGGFYLAYEGVHKIVEKFFSKDKVIKEKKIVSENQKVFGAIKTDLILSIEIIVIANSYINAELLERLLSLSSVGILASIIIYGLVSLIVKIDDFGIYLIEKDKKSLGLMFVNSMPWIMKSLGIIGTIAMLMVAGGIFSHALHANFIPVKFLQDIILGLIGGLLAMLPVSLVQKFL